LFLVLELKRKHSLYFKPFPELVDSVTAGTLSPETHRRVISEFIENGDYTEAEKRSVLLLDIALRASAYYQKYVEYPPIKR
jgi:hypothetical protein